MAELHGKNTFQGVRWREESRCSLVGALVLGYTFGMKIAISISNEVFKKAARLAQCGRKSRSQVFSEAMLEYAARHDSDGITESWNAVLADVGDEPEEWVGEVSRRALERSEW